MPSSRRSSPQSMPDAQMVEVPFVRLFAERKGIVALAFGVGGHFKNGPYAFKRFRHRYFDYPDQLQKIVDVVVCAAPVDDVYIIPYLRTARRASNGFVVMGIF